MPYDLLNHRSGNKDYRCPKGVLITALTGLPRDCLKVKVGLLLCPSRPSPLSIENAPHHPPKCMGNPKNPIIRQSTIRKLRTVYRWRRHKFLGRKHEFMNTSSLCYIWPYSMGMHGTLLSRCYMGSDNGGPWVCGNVLDSRFPGVICWLARYLNCKCPDIFS